MIKKQIGQDKIKYITKIVISLILLLFTILGISSTFDHSNKSNNHNISLVNQAQLVADNNQSYQQIKTQNNHYVTNSNNDYFVLTKTGVVKLDVFGNVYYNYSFANNFINYEAVDFVADSLKDDYYYLLIKNPVVSVNGNDLNTLSVSSPAYVLQLKDENNTLNVIKTFQLGAFRFSRDIATLYSRIGFELTPTSTNLAGLLDKPINNTLMNNISAFYDHAISKLVFINNRIGVFGSSNELSLWFYLFNVNQTNDFTNNTDVNLITIFPQLYGMTNLNWSLNNSINNANQATNAQFVINNIRLYTPAYYVIGANVVRQNLGNQNGLLNSQQTAIYSLHLGLVPAPLSAIRNNNQFGYKISSTYFNADNRNYSNLFVSGVISQTKVAQITNNVNILNEFFSSSYTLRLNTSNLSNNSQTAYSYSVQEDDVDQNNSYPNLVGILLIKNEIIGFLYSADSYNLIAQINYQLISDDVSMANFDLLTNISLKDNDWYLTFFDPRQSTSWTNIISPTISQTSNGTLAINYTKIYQADQPGTIFLTLVLGNSAFYTLSNENNKVDLNLVFYDQKTQGFRQASFFKNGVPSFDNVPGSDGSKLWGRISFKPDSYLVKQDLNTTSAMRLSNNTLLLNNLYEYTPGEIDWKPRVIPTALDDSILRLSIQLPYFDGNYYGSNQRLVNLSFPSFIYDNLNAYPSYVIPTVVVSVVAIFILIIAFVFLIVVNILKTKKISVDLFRNANRKVDKLNDSVNIIYEKIETKLYSAQSEPKKIANNQTRVIHPQFRNQTVGINPTNVINPNVRPGMPRTPYPNQTRAYPYQQTGFVPPNQRPPFNNQTRQFTPRPPHPNQTRATPTQQYGFYNQNKKPNK
ncbi:cytadherence protein C [Mycoplasma tullyi]|uniref:Cytadherence protein C n=1 Tax=Mycoplasma tullyi TaxID=1612150 RepID=A0A7D7U8M7_9MOLU|nr:cytadherence protein C [Mycoplasma tullyi]QMT98683.1 cytadherence protein C [Mycoplasma tullyi]